jgi:hypothetical protein
MSKSLNLFDYLFSLEGKGILKTGFSDFVKDNNELKLVVLFYYASIIYYVAKLLKADKKNIPFTISFSGNGSKVFTLLNNETGIKEFTECIFEQIYAKQEKIELQFDRNPKQISCIGVLNLSNDQIDNLQIKTRDIYRYLLGDKEQTLVSSHSLDTVNESLIDSIVANVNAFIEFFFSLNSKYDFYENLLIKNETADFEIYKTKLTQYTRSFLQKGIGEMRENIAKGDTANETMFFYALKGGLFQLSNMVIDPTLKS